MNLCDIHIEVMSDQLESSAEWRRGKAVEYPEDAKRNLEAASLLERLAVGVRKLEGSDIHARISALCEDDDVSYTLTEEYSQLMKEVGFHWFSDDPREFLGELIKRVERH